MPETGDFGYEGVCWKSHRACVTSIETLAPSIVTNASASLRISPTNFFRTTSSKLRASVSRCLSAAWFRQQKADIRPGDSWPSMPSAYANETLIADLDALSLSQPELELLRRMEQVCHTTRMAEERRRRRQSMPDVRMPTNLSKCKTCPSFNPDLDLHLRGGGGESERPPFSGPRRRTTLPQATSRTPLLDSERPQPAVWWLAGGRHSRNGQVPTVGDLRVRKEVEQANRSIVGFWGTVLGRRRVGTVGILAEGGGGNGEEAAAEEVLGGGGGFAKDGSVHSGSVKSVDVVGGEDAREVEDVAAEAVEGELGSMKNASGHDGSAKSAHSGGEKAKDGAEEANGDKVDDGEAAVVRDAPKSEAGSAKDRSVHGGSVNSVEARERAQEEFGVEAAAVDRDAGAEARSVRSREERSDGDEHTGEMNAKEAAGATEAVSASMPPDEKDTST